MEKILPFSTVVGYFFVLLASKIMDKMCTRLKFFYSSSLTYFVHLLGFLPKMGRENKERTKRNTNIYVLI